MSSGLAEKFDIDTNVKAVVGKNYGKFAILAYSKVSDSNPDNLDIFIHRYNRPSRELNVKYKISVDNTVNVI